VRRHAKASSAAPTQRRVEANFTGQNGKIWDKTPELVPTACKAKAHKHKRRK
jgi:hypothetical protein